MQGIGAINYLDGLEDAAIGKTKTTSSIIFMLNAISNTSYYAI